jgi:hypothetical protein
MPESSRPAKPEVDDEVTTERGPGPIKTARSTSRRTIRGKTVRKPTVAASKKAAAGGGRAKDDRPDQAGRRSRSTDSYVRFRVRVENGNLRVVDSHVVEGTLEPTTFFPGNYAYEVSLDGQRLHAGALPDLGIMRAFAPPGAKGELVGHNIRELDSYGFNVRVPSKDLSTRALGQMTIRLFRVKDAHDRGLDSPAALDRHIETNMREVAQVTGVPTAARPKWSGGKPFRRRPY